MPATTGNGAGQRIDPRTDPVFGLIYGDPKGGKSGDIAFGFPDAEWVAAPGALGVTASVVGRPVPPERIHQSTNLKGALDVVKAVLQRPESKRPKAVAIDDLTLIIDVTAREEEQSPKNMSMGGKLDGRKLWREVRNQLLDLRTEARKGGLHILMNSHASKPFYRKDTDGNDTHTLLEKGGPAIPGQMREGLPAAVDCVFRAYKTEAAFVSLWPMAYHAANDDLWQTGNRLLPPINPLPANIGEIIRASGRVLPEPFPGHNDRVEKISAILQQHEEKDWQSLVEAAWAKLLTLLAGDGKKTYWVMRDALARAQIRMKLASYYAKPRLYSGSVVDDF